MQRINFYLSEVQINRLREKSGQTGLSKSELLRRAIDAYLDSPPVPAIAATPSGAPAGPISRSRRRRPDTATQAARIAALAVDEEGPRDFDPESAGPGGAAAGPEAGHDLLGGSNPPSSPRDPGHRGGDTTGEDAESEDEAPFGDDDGRDEAGDDAATTASFSYFGPCDPVLQQEARFQLNVAEQRYTTEVLFESRSHGGDQDKAALIVLRNPTLSFPPLFRYGVAVGMAVLVGGDLSAKFEELAARFEAAAAEQYSASPPAYDREWGGLIPERLGGTTGREPRA